MDQDCSAGHSLGLGIADGTITDEMYVWQRNVSGPPLQLHLFPSAPDSYRSTLPWEKTSPSIEAIGVGGEGSAGEAKVLIYPVAVTWRSDGKKFPASYFYNEDAGAIKQNGAMARSWRMTEFGRGYSTMWKNWALPGRSLDCPENSVVFWKKASKRTGHLNLKKLKQIKVDCEVMKRYNEALADENRKLQMELEKLKALKMSSPPLRPSSTLRMCPSCERV
eukprot:PITA_19791